MLLAVDIGNTATKLGVFNGDALAARLSVPTDQISTPESFEAAVGDGIPSEITSAIACSVVPQLEDPLAEYVSSRFGIPITFINATFDLGLRVKYESPDSLGPDRFVGAFAASELYGTPVCVCSFGTALTIDAVSPEKDFLGGIIAPSMALMAKALSRDTAKLPAVQIHRPDSLFGNSTVTSIRAGVYYGYIGMFEGIVSRMLDVLGSETSVVATGGAAEMVANETSLISNVEPNLVLKGLRMIGSRLTEETEL